MTRWLVLAAGGPPGATPPAGALVAWDMPRSPVFDEVEGSFWLAGPGEWSPPGPALVLSGDAELVGGDEGGRLHGQALGGEPDLAVDGQLAAVAFVGLAGHRAAEAGSPVRQ